MIIQYEQVTPALYRGYFDGKRVELRRAVATESHENELWDVYVDGKRTSTYPRFLAYVKEWVDGVAETILARRRGEPRIYFPPDHFVNRGAARKRFTP